MVLKRITILFMLVALVNGATQVYADVKGIDTPHWELDGVDKEALEGTNLGGGASSLRIVSRNANQALSRARQLPRAELFVADNYIRAALKYNWRDRASTQLLLEGYWLIGMELNSYASEFAEHKDDYVNRRPNVVREELYDADIGYAKLPYADIKRVEAWVDYYESIEKTNNDTND
jgi:hypothetical protein